MTMEFVLHEDDDTTEAEVKTSELHRFLEDARISDWEGNNGGISIYPLGWPDEIEEWLEAVPGDVIVRDDEGNITVRRRR